MLVVDRNSPVSGDVGAPNATNRSCGWGKVAWEESLGHEVHVLKDGHVVRTGFFDAVTVGGRSLDRAEGVESRAFYETARGHVALRISRPPVPIVH